MNIPERRIVTVHTPEGALTLTRPIAERLLAEGVICGELDKVLHASDAAIVKTAIMSHAVCDFCGVPGASVLFNVPDFELPDNAGQSIGGWMACEICDKIIRESNKSALLERATTTLAFPKFTKSLIQELHLRFWKGIDALSEAKGIASGIEGFVEDKMIARKAALSDRALRLEAVSRIMEIPEDQIEKLIKGDITPALAKKLVSWRKLINKKEPADIADILARGGLIKPPLPQGHIPHWQVALDARFGAASLLERAMNAPRDIFRYTESLDIKDPKVLKDTITRTQAFKTLRDLGFAEDVKYLKAADSYSFNSETIAAIREAAKSIPHESPLSSIETPSVGAGWFWFAEPLPVTCSPVASSKTNGLLWGWSNGRSGGYKLTIDTEVLKDLTPEQLSVIRSISERNGAEMITSEDAKTITQILRDARISQAQFDEICQPIIVPALMFSAYVTDPKGLVGAKNEPLPSTRWYWPIDMSFTEMLEYNAQSWEKQYGSGSEFEKNADIVGKEVTLNCIGELSLFFLAACVWFKQRIIVSSPGHIERHARKRYVRDYKLKEQPSVRVIALRASLREPSEPREPGQQTGTREYHYRWIVKGHPRLQVCGPGRRDRKLIWIDPYPKGPEDKPLRTREKVFAVIR